MFARPFLLFAFAERENRRFEGHIIAEKHLPSLRISQACLASLDKGILPFVINNSAKDREINCNFCSLGR